VAAALLLHLLGGCAHTGESSASEDGLRDGREVVTDSMAVIRPQILDCYDEQIDRMGRAVAGYLEVSFRIRPDGRAERVDFESGHAFDEDMERCVARAIVDDARFWPTREPRQADVTYRYFLRVPSKGGGGGGRQERFSQRVVERTIRSEQRALQRCYDRAPGITGKVGLAIRVRPDGDFSEVRVVENTTGNTALAQCIRGVVDRLRTPFGPEQEVELTYPFVFHELED
jgi:hypothetical protein